MFCKCYVNFQNVYSMCHYIFNQWKFFQQYYLRKTPAKQSQPQNCCAIIHLFMHTFSQSLFSNCFVLVRKVVEALDVRMDRMSVSHNFYHLFDKNTYRAPLMCQLKCDLHLFSKNIIFLHQITWKHCRQAAGITGLTGLSFDNKKTSI